MLHSHAYVIESLEILGLIIMHLLLWQKAGPISRVVGPYCLIALTYDVLIAHCERPDIVAYSFNYGNMGIALIVLYENFKDDLRALVAALLSLFM